MDFSSVTEEDEDRIIALTLEHLTDGAYVENCMRKQFASGKYYGVKATEDGELAGYLTFKEGIDFTYPHDELRSEVIKEAKGRKKKWKMKKKIMKDDDKNSITYYKI